MPTLIASEKIHRVVLVGNYGPDRQESMLRFTRMVADALRDQGVTTEELASRPKASRLLRGYRQAGLAKWLGYLDKYVLFSRELWWHRRQASLGARTVYHITDHSNSTYVPILRGTPVLVTCHDLLAVRGALGEDTSCRASRTGQVLQKSILRGLAKAHMVACVSQFTRNDLRRLLPIKPVTESTVVPNGLNYPYRRRGRGDAEKVLRFVSKLNPAKPYLLHVGSNLPRKNKPTVLRAFASLPRDRGYQLVLAGPSLTPELSEMVAQLEIGKNVIVVEKPDNTQLEALYSMAVALLFPSLAEGFGWPVIEAQACGCPVICADTTSLPEVAGVGAQFTAPLDHEGMAAAVERLSDPDSRQTWSALGLQNAARFSTATMARSYIDLYTGLVDGRQ